MNADPLAEALFIAREGRGRVEPNPQVGAVVVKNGAIIGRGAHRVFGGCHAEVEALRDAGEQARGATIYVTLEPCCTEGKTPPCTNAIIEAGIANVVWAIDDPNPDHAGRAARILEAAGLTVTPNAAHAAGQELLRRFDPTGKSQRPFVIAKWAQTIDGATTTPSNAPPEISGPESRRRVHEDRATCDGILIGGATAIADDPELTVRIVEGTSPHRFILDSALRTPITSKLLRMPPATTFFCGPSAPQAHADGLRGAGARVIEVASCATGLDIPTVLRHLCNDGIKRLYVEGGRTIHESFLNTGCVDHLQVYVAGAARSDCSRSVIAELVAKHGLIDAITEEYGADVLLSGYCR